MKEDDKILEARFNQIFVSVVNSLPIGARETLQKFWKAEMALNPITGERSPAPTCILGQNWTEQAAAEGVSSLANALDGRCMIFDLEFLRGAPEEVISTLIAHELAHVLTTARGEKKPATERARERAVKHRIRRWGYEENEIELWVAAKSATPSQAVEMYYAYRYERFHRPPPATADLKAIVLLMEHRGRSELAQKIGTIPSPS